MTPEVEKQSRRCPRLGGPVLFSYCLYGYDENKDGSSACFKVFDCWWETFDVDAYIKTILDETAYKSLLEKAGKQPKPKVLSLLDIIEQARARTGQ